MSYKPANFPTLSPILTVRDAQASINFYQQAFGFELPESPIKDEQGNITHVGMSYKDAVIMFGPEGAYDKPNQAPVTLNVLPSSALYLYCEDVDALYNKAINAGAKSVVEPEDMFWGDRMCKVTDIDGYEWAFATHLSQ